MHWIDPHLYVFNCLMVFLTRATRWQCSRHCIYVVGGLHVCGCLKEIKLKKNRVKFVIGDDLELPQLEAIYSI